MAPTSVPRCSATSKVFSSEGLPAKSSQPNSHGTRIRWPDDEIGRYSASPWVMPRTMAWRIDTVRGD
jgi:hypothetical protein